MLQLESVNKTSTRGGSTIHALRDANESFPKGTFNVLKGPSGSGKSTLLLILGGMLRPTSGIVRVEGNDLYAGDRDKYRAETVGFVFQTLHLLPYLNIIDNVLAVKPIVKENRKQRATELLESLGLAHRMAHRPRELSIGERQRVAVARALLNQPKIILADEPTGNLDPENSEAIMRTFAEFRDDGGTVILVTHNPDADAFADAQFTLRDGTIEAAQEAPVA